MATYYPSTPFPAQFINPETGELLSGGSISAYASGTSDSAAMYTDADGTEAGTEITVNAGGYPEVDGNTIVIWLETGLDYKFILRDSDRNEKWIVDNFSNWSSGHPPSGSALIFDSIEDLISGRDIDGRVIDFGGLPSSRVMARTKEYHAGSRCGGAEYLIKPLDEHRADIGDSGWTPGHGVNHHVGDDGTHVAVLQHDGSIRDVSAGVITDYDEDALTGTDNTAALQQLFDYCFLTRTHFIGTGRTGIGSTVYPCAMQRTGNYRFPFELHCQGWELHYTGGAGYAIDFNHTTSQRSYRNLKLHGKIRVINRGLGTTGIRFRGANWLHADTIEVTGFRGEEQVLFSANDGKGGLWNHVNHIWVRGFNEDQTGETGALRGGGLGIDEYVNALTIDKIWAGYAGTGKMLVRNDGSRQQFTSISLEDGGDYLAYGFKTNGHCNIGSLEVEMNGPNADFVGGLAVTDDFNVKTHVHIGHFTNRGLSSKAEYYDEGVNVLILGASNAVDSRDRVELISNKPIRIAESWTPKRCFRFEFTFDDSSIGKLNGYETYRNIGGSGSDRSLAVQGGFISTNGLSEDCQIQLRAENELGDATPYDYAIIDVPAGTESPAVVLDLYHLSALYSSDQLLRSVVGRARSLVESSISGSFTITIVGFYL